MSPKHWPRADRMRERSRVAVILRDEMRMYIKGSASCGKSNRRVRREGIARVRKYCVDW